MPSYHRPHELRDALAVLREGAITVIAGGTDYYPARVERPLDEDLLDITGLPRCAGSSTPATHFRIGAGVTWSRADRAPTCRPASTG